MEAVVSTSDETIESGCTDEGDGNKSFSNNIGELSGRYELPYICFAKM